MDRPTDEVPRRPEERARNNGGRPVIIGAEPMASTRHALAALSGVPTRPDASRDARRPPVSPIRPPAVGDVIFNGRHCRVMWAERGGELVPVAEVRGGASKAETDEAVRLAKYELRGEPTTVQHLHIILPGGAVDALARAKDKRARRAARSSR